MEMVVVHCGAGVQCNSKYESYRSICDEAADAALKALNAGETALDAVCKAICCLENSPMTNAAVGSNLCMDGTIECDASLMEGKTLNWAGVGAMPDIRNPILVPKLLLKAQEAESPFGLISPNMLVGPGAQNWALSKGLETSQLITEKSRLTYTKYKQIIDGEKIEFREAKRQRLDTVGAIAIDREGNLAAGVSSGGIIFKIPGRVGQAATYASGCWADESTAISTSGVGEYLTKTMLAKEASEAMRVCDVDTDEKYIDYMKKFFQQKFIDSPYLRNIQCMKASGLIALHKNVEQKKIYLVYLHNTPTMCLSFRSNSVNEFVLSKYSSDSITDESTTRCVSFPFR